MKNKKERAERLVLFYLGKEFEGKGKSFLKLRLSICEKNGEKTRK